MYKLSVMDVRDARRASIPAVVVLLACGVAPMKWWLAKVEQRWK